MNLKEGGGSCMVYLVTFLTSILIIYIGEQLYQQSKYVGMFVMIMAIMLPTILAGCRDTSVGTDTGAYIYYFDVIKEKTSILDAWTDPYILRVGLEKGYILLNFIVSRFVSNGHWMLGVLAFLTNLFILIGARNYKDRYPTWMIMIIYYMVFACVTFNIARQGLANAIVFAGAALLDRKKYFRFILVTLLAFSIHNTALIAGILLLLIKIYLERNRSLLRVLLLLIAVTFGMIFYQVPMNMLLSIFPSYSGYVAEYGGTEATISILGLLLKVPIVVVATIYFRQADEVSSNYYIYYIFVLLDLMLSQFGAFLGPLARISYYFAYYKLLLAPEIYYSYASQEGSHQESNSKIFVGLMIMWIIGYWYIMAVCNTYGYGHPIYPYTSDILNIS